MPVPLRRSLTTRALMHGVGAVALVIAATTGGAYFAVLKAMEREGLAALSDYANERSRRESQVFTQAEKNLRLIKSKFREQWNLPPAEEPGHWFSERVSRTPDGAWRSIPERTRRGIDATAWVRAGTETTPELKRAMMTAGELCETYFPAWETKLGGLYVSSPMDFNIGISLGEPDWVWMVEPDFDQSSFEWAKIASVEENPERLARWSAVVPGLETSNPPSAFVTLSDPMDLEGRHFVTFHQDLELGELIHNTAQSERPGVEHVIFREDGRAIATPKVGSKLIAGGNYFLQASEDVALRQVHRAAMNAGTFPWAGYDKESDRYVALGKLDGPGWIFASILSGPELRKQATGAAQWVLWSGLGALALALPSMFYILRRGISRPLEQLIQTIRRMGEGDTGVRVAWKSQDELGQLADAFNQMAGAVAERDSSLQRLNQELEQRIIERTEGMRQSEERFSKAFHGSHAMLAIFGAEDGQFIDANTAFLENFGYRREEIVGRRQADLNLWSAPVSGLGEARRQEIPARTRTGEERLLSYSGDRVMIGTTPCILMAAEDITERKRSETEVLNALEREKELNQLKDNFVAMVSHEFRTPLEVITTSTDILTRYLDRVSPEERTKQLGTIQDAVRRMVSMMEEVLLLGRVEAGRMRNQPEDLHLSAWCRRMIEEISTASPHNRRIKLEMEAFDPMVMADESLLRHVFTNLLSNALKYSAADTEVRFSVRRDGNDAVFRIKDDGVGIPAKDLPHLFDGFHRGGNVGQRPGTGLGLVIAKRCLDLQGGEIAIESQEGHGTVVTVRIPLFEDVSQSNPLS